MLVFQRGDSGAWVIDARTCRVYGYIVASDVFGRAYVVALQDVFDDIEDRLGSKITEIGSKLAELPAWLRQQQSSSERGMPSRASFAPSDGYMRLETEQIIFPQADPGRAIQYRHAVPAKRKHSDRSSSEGDPVEQILGSHMDQTLSIQDQPDMTKQPDVRSSMPEYTWEAYWNCCWCSESYGMSVKLNPGCVGCDHHRCNNCHTYRVKVRYSR